MGLIGALFFFAWCAREGVRAGVLSSSLLSSPPRPTPSPTSPPHEPPPARFACTLDTRRALGSLVWAFEPNLLSGLGFFMLALLAAASTVAAYLAAIYAATAGGIYFAARASVAALEAQRANAERLRHRSD